MKLYKITSIYINILFTASCIAQSQCIQKSISLYQISDSNVHKNYWLPAAEGLVINSTIWAFDKFVLKGSYAQITPRSIDHNLENGMVWDNDNLSTNLFFHPYNGSLFFSAARANGLNFQQSILYSMGGSLIWEFFLENEPPAINDFLATGFGGNALGEVLFRLSSLTIRPKSRGWDRVFREAACFLISPLHAINRWVTPNQSRKNNYQVADIPFRLSAYITDRYLISSEKPFQSINAMGITVLTQYGNAHKERIRKPFEFFEFQTSFSLFSQPAINEILLTGTLISNTYDIGEYSDLTWGLFQHFNYFNSRPIKSNSEELPYELAIPVAYGTGLLYQKEHKSWTIQCRAYINAIVLGGIYSDYFRNIDRDYNMGQGLGSQWELNTCFRERFLISLQLRQYMIYTWKGFHGEDFFSVHNDLYLNAQGNTSIGNMLILTPRFEYFITENISILLKGYWYYRYTNYKYFSPVEKNTFEIQLGVGGTF